MPKSISAGLLMYCDSKSELRVLLAHPGGPFFANKDAGAWSIPKGLTSAVDSDLLATAKREFCEETGYDLSGVDDYLPIDHVTLKSGKEVHAWAFAGVWETGRVPQATRLRSNGRQNRDACSLFRRSIAPKCSRCQWQE